MCRKKLLLKGKEREVIMKRAIIISALIAALASPVGAYAAIVPAYDGNVLTLDLKTGLQAGSNAVISVLQKGAEQIVQNAYAMEECVAPDGGVIKIKFEMPEERDGSTDGEYVVYLNGAEFDTFSFAAKSTREALLEMLKNAAVGSEIINAIDNNAGYRLAAFSLGLEENIWNSLSDEEKSAIASDFVSAQKETDTAKQFFTYVGAKALSAKKADAEAVLNMINPQYKDIYYKSITDADLKSYIDTYILNTLPSAQEFQKEYERVNVLNLLNNAKFNEINSLITENASLLNLSGKSEYIKYTNMSAADKNTVCDNIVRKLAKSKLSSVSDFANVFAECTKISSDSGSSSGGSGGSGGGSSGSSGGGSSNSNGTYIVSNGNQTSDDDFVFDDVKNHWSKDAVAYLYKKGIVSGTDKNEFEPSRNVTREEFLTMLIKAKGIEAKDGNKSFTDTAENAWYNPFVNAAVASGIAFGIDEDTFGIGMPITRQDMFCMVARILEADNSVVQTGSISDIEDVSDYAKDAVTSLYRRGIISGTGDGKTEPKKNTTRAEAAALIYKLLSK